MTKAILNQSEIESSINESKLLDLQGYLKQYNRSNCPDVFYRAWKILILGTNEYYQDQELILNDAIENLIFKFQFPQ